MITEWHRHCETGNCVETRLVGDQVEIRDTDRPEATLLVPAKAWQEFLAAEHENGGGHCVCYVITKEREAELSAAPRTWAPTQIDKDVNAVTDEHGRLWHRVAAGLWEQDDVEGCWGEQELIQMRGPLVEVRNNEAESRDA